MDDEKQWEVTKGFLLLAASYLVIKVAQSNAVNEMPTAFKVFQESLDKFQEVLMLDSKPGSENPEVELAWTKGYKKGFEEGRNEAEQWARYQNMPADRGNP